MKPIWTKLTIFIGLTTWMLFILLFSVFVNAYNGSFYSHEYDQYGLNQTTGLSRQDYQNGMDTLLDYLQDKRDDIHVNVIIDGSTRELFNQKEIDHMIDVKSLAQHATMVMIICGVITVTVGIVLIPNRSVYLKAYPFCFKSFHLVLLGSLIGLTIMILCDFNAFWTTFHHIFFPGNDLWLLDPSTDWMIRMLPGNLFMDLVIRILVTFGLTYGLSHALLLWLNRYLSKREVIS